MPATATVIADNGSKKGMSLWLKGFIWVVVIIVDVFILWYLAEDPSNRIDKEKDQSKIAAPASLQKEESKDMPDSLSDIQNIISDAEDTISSSPAIQTRSIDASTTEVAPQIIKSAIDSSTSSLLIAESAVRERVRVTKPASNPDAVELATKESMKETMRPIVQYNTSATGVQSLDKRLDAKMRPTTNSAGTTPRAAVASPGKSIAPPARAEVSVPAAASTSVQGGLPMPAAIPVHPQGTAAVRQERKFGRRSAAARERHYGYRQGPGYQRQPALPRTQAYTGRRAEQRARQARPQRRVQPNYYPRAPWGYNNSPYPYSGYGGGYQRYPFNRPYSIPAAPTSNSSEGSAP